jgi:uncharacterized membrane protein YGL010W
MKKIDAYFADYRECHRTKGNMVCHSYGIPMIVLGILGLFGRVPIGSLSLAVPVALIAVTFYLWLHFMLGATMIVTLAALYFVAMHLSVPVLWAVFVAGWIFQGVGHYKYEHKSPAFFQNFTHLLIGPIYLQNYLTRLYKL